MAQQRRTTPKKSQIRQSRRKQYRVKRTLNFRAVFFFLFLLIAIFFASYMIAGGDTIFEAHTASNIHHAITNSNETEKLERMLESDDKSGKTSDKKAINQNQEEQPSIMNRVERVLFIKTMAEYKTKSIKNYVKIKDIPEALQQAVISIEDNHFYEHYGFDINGIGRAALVNLQYGEVKEGASTITQQLVKNMFLSQEQSIGRKAEELILAIDMEMTFSKEEILEMYLNSIYFGSGYYGIGEASYGYFGKKPSQLNLSEAAMLAGIPNAPSLYSPYVDFILAKKRQIKVLDDMKKLGYIKESVAEDAKIKPIVLAH